MATKTDKTEKSDKKPAAKKVAAAPKAAKAAPAKHKTASPFHAVKEQHDGKEKLAKALSTLVGAPDDDTDVIAQRLKKASNKQLLRLHAVTETVKRKFGSREKLVAKLAAGHGKDKDYLAKLGTYTLPRLLDLARNA